jgi:SPP1 gp7 family putative phage head morphogenesis protein
MTRAPRYPLEVEIRNVRRYERIADRLVAIARRALSPALASLQREQRTDDARGDLLRSLQRVRIELFDESATDKAQTTARLSAAEIERYALREQLAALRVLGLDVFGADAALAAARREFVRDNVSLIKTLPETLFADIEERTKRSISEGWRHETLAKEIEGAYGNTASRARLIARDQTNKHNGALAQTMQESAGIVSYRWSATLDARTRPEHLALNGTIQQWGSPPDIGHPGEPIQCRCVAIPVLTTITAPRAPSRPSAGRVRDLAAKR